MPGPWLSVTAQHMQCLKACPSLSLVLWFLQGKEFSEHLLTT